jgi:hypothetical protein
MQNIKKVFRNDGTTFPEEIQKFFTQENLRKVQSAGCRFRQKSGGFFTALFDGDDYFVYQFDEKGFVEYMTLIKEAHEEEEQKKFQWQPIEMQLAKIPRSKEQVLLALNNPEKFQGFTFTFSFKYRTNANTQYVGKILDNNVNVYWFGDSTGYIISETLKQNIKGGIWIIDEPIEG